MKRVNNFYIHLYFFWLKWVSLRTFALSFSVSFFVTVYIYFSKGRPALNEESFLALKEVFLFSFPFTFSFSFIIMLLLVFKAVFYIKIKEKKLRLYNCQDKVIEKPLLSDVNKIWRKWLFLSIWAVLFLILILLGLDTLLLGGENSNTVFNGISLYLYVIVLGGSIFTLGMKKCKKVRIQDV